MYTLSEIRKFEKRLRAFRGIESALSTLHDELLKIRSNVEISSGSTNSFSSGVMDCNSREKSLVWYISKEQNIGNSIRKKEVEYIILKSAFNCLDDEEKRIIEKFYFQNKGLTSIAIDLHYSEITIKRKKKKALKKMMDFVNNDKK